MIEATNPALRLINVSVYTGGYVRMSHLGMVTFCMQHAPAVLNVKRHIHNSCSYVERGRGGMQAIMPSIGHCNNN